MRSFRPSGKAIVVAGALAAALVVAGTSGAVAARLVTSQNIKNGTIKAEDLGDNSVTNDKIARGAVDWDKSLSPATKRQIESMLGAGRPGPQGPAGAPGPAGAQGATGPQGPAGMGRLAFWDYFVNSGESPNRLVPMNHHEIALSEPGDYLVTLRGLSLVDSETEGPAAITLGEPDDQFDFFAQACLPTGLGMFEIPIATCNITYPLSIPVGGGTVQLPVIATPMGGACGEECEFQAGPTYAGVAIYKVNSTPTPEPQSECGARCERSMERQLSPLSRELNLR